MHFWGKKHKLETTAINTLFQCLFKKVTFGVEEKKRGKEIK